MEVLLQNRIAPRIQVFVNKENLGELAQVEALVRDLDLEARCRAFGEDFDLFLHPGSCDGENEKLYDIRVTPEDLEKIPPALAARTLRYLQRESLQQVFGRTEQALCAELRADASTASLAEPNPVFYVDAAFDVYPNFTAPRAGLAPGQRARRRRGGGPCGLRAGRERRAARAPHDPPGATWRPRRETSRASGSLAGTITSPTC